MPKITYYLARRAKGTARFPEKSDFYGSTHIVCDLIDETLCGQDIGNGRFYVESMDKPDLLTKPTCKKCLSIFNKEVEK